jgi:hypothetical protein
LLGLHRVFLQRGIQKESKEFKEYEEREIAAKDRKERKKSRGRDHLRFLPGSLGARAEGTHPVGIEMKVARYEMPGSDADMIRP